MTSSSGLLTKGVIVSTTDPDHLSDREGCVQVRVPIFHGPSRQSDLPSGAQSQWVKDKDLPWMEVIYPVGTVNPNVSSFFKINEIVYVTYTTTSSTRGVVIGTTGRLLKKSAQST